MSSTRNFNPHAPYSLKIHAFIVPSVLSSDYGIVCLWKLIYTSEHLLQCKQHMSPFFCPLKYVFILYGARHKLASAILCAIHYCAELKTYGT